MIVENSVHGVVELSSKRISRFSRLWFKCSDVGSYKRDSVRFACEIGNHRHDAYAGESLSPRRLTNDRTIDSQPDTMLLSASSVTFHPAAEGTVSRGNEFGRTRSSCFLHSDDVTHCLTLFQKLPQHGQSRSFPSGTVYGRCGSPRLAPLCAT